LSADEDMVEARAADLTSRSSRPDRRAAPSRSDIVNALRSAGCVHAEDEAQVLMSAANTAAELTAMVNRRVGGQPVEHIVGWAEFCGLRVDVRPGVFIPRRRTEFLVHQAVALTPPRAVVVDLCCGSGAVGSALIAALDGVELHAVELDPTAVVCARRNIGTAGQVYEGDLYDPLPTSLQGRVDVLVANAPYVPSAEIVLLPAEARKYEPRMTLDGGFDGLDVVRRVVAAAPTWLAPGGRLFLEVSERQASRVVDAMASCSLVPHVATDDELDATVVIGSL
jgi:release factor glutamine methyltransferase